MGTVVLAFILSKWSTLIENTVIGMSQSQSFVANICYFKSFGFSCAA